MRSSLQLCSKLARHSALRHPRIVAAGARAQAAVAQASSSDDASASVSSVSTYAPRRAPRAMPADYSVEAESFATRSAVCPCCFGAVHKNMRIPSDFSFRAFSTMASTSSTSTQQSVIDLVIADHNEAKSLFARYGATTDLKEKENLARQLIKALSEHGAQEEMTIYPWMKSHDKSSVGMVDHGIEEHRDLKKALYELDQLSDGAANPKFDQVVQKVWKTLSHHIEEEESRILPKMREMATKEELIELGNKFNSVKIIAPSRPHPAAPSEGIPAMMANMGAAAVDKLRDAGREAKESMASERKQQ